MDAGARIRAHQQAAATVLVRRVQRGGKTRQDHALRIIIITHVQSYMYSASANSACTCIASSENAARKIIIIHIHVQCMHKLV